MKGARRVHSSHDVGRPAVDQPKISVVGGLITKNGMRAVGNVLVTRYLKKIENKKIKNLIKHWDEDLKSSFQSPASL